MGRRTIGRHWPTSAPLLDYPSPCDICGAPWRRSLLRYDGRGMSVCPNHGNGADPFTLDQENLAGAQAWAEELASRPPRDMPTWVETDDLTPAPGGYTDPNDPSLPGGPE